MTSSNDSEIKETFSKKFKFDNIRSVTCLTDQYTKINYMFIYYKTLKNIIRKIKSFMIA